jgi:hypothetical protein
VIELLCYNWRFGLITGDFFIDVFDVYNFVRLKATHKISPLEELVGGRSPEVNRYVVRR